MGFISPKCTTRGGFEYCKKVGVCFLGESGCTGADEGSLLSCSSATSKPISKAKRAIILPFKSFVTRLSLQSSKVLFYKAIMGYFSVQFFGRKQSRKLNHVTSSCLGAILVKEIEFGCYPRVY
jgi:hypothetical protein